MTIVLVVLCIWGCSALIRAYSTKQSQREFQRIDSEIRKRKLEQKQMAQELAKQKRDAENYVRRQIALEREQMKLAKEQQKQAEQIAKHDKRIEALEYKVRKLDRDIASQNELLADYYAQLDWLLLQQSGTVAGGNEFAKWQNKIVTKNNQIRKVENKLADMRDAMEKAERELAA